MSCLQQNPDRLYELVPVVYRLRDADRGYPLRALLRVIAEQVNLVEQDIAGLYENWFIETCQDWVVPYIGDAHQLPGRARRGEPTDRHGTALPPRRVTASCSPGANWPTPCASAAARGHSRRWRNWPS